MPFQAILVQEDGPQAVNTDIQELSLEQLPEGNVTVAIEYSALNYKDGLCLQPHNGLVRNYPHVPGIDFAGTVENSHDARYQVGDQVVLTGWGVGERHWGGFSQKARVNADWLVPLPKGLTTRQAMAIGTAGLAAMLAIIALEEHGLKSEQGEVLVTGATGGVGSIATSVLANLGYQVTAVTGSPASSEYLTMLGAQRIIPRSDLDSLSKKPLEPSTWSGCVDAVGGEMLARIIGQLQYGASAAAVGLAAGPSLPTSLIPFLLRGINLLGIDSVLQPYENRLIAWQRLSNDLPLDKLEGMIQSATLAEVPALANDILAGKIRGRVVIDMNA